MKKKIIVLWMMVCLFLAVVTPVFAEEGLNNPSMSRVDDQTDVFTAAEEAELESSIQDIQNTYQVDAAIVTIDAFTSDAENEEAAAYFLDQGYGYGDNQDGVLLMIATDQRHYEIITHGSCIVAMTDYGIEYMQDQMIDDLSDSDYYEASTAFLSASTLLLEQAATGEPYDVDNEIPGTEASKLIPELIAALIAIVIAGAVGFGLVKMMEQSKEKQSADDFIDQASFHVSESRDTFLYMDVITHVHKKDDNGGGGSSTFDFGDSSFGGGGGDF